MSNIDTKTSRRHFLGLAAAGSVVSLGAGAITPLAAQTTGESAKSPSRAHYKIFSPGHIGKMPLKNRIVRSAAFEGGGDADGFVTDDMIRIHRAYSAGGVGLTLTGYMSVMEYGRKGSHVCASQDRYIPGLAKLAKAVHDAAPDCKIGAEIGHDGSASPITTGGGPTAPARLTNPSGGQWPNRIGPSGIDWRGEKNAHEMTVAEIERFCVDMGHATRRLREAGFDCVEIHGAHHYLINTFLSPFTNRRTDAYGATLENRVRIVKNMVGEMRRHVGRDFPIIIKLNCDDGASDNGTPGEIDIQTFPALVNEIAKTGIDAIDISGGEKAGDPMRMNLGDVKDQSFYERYANVLNVDIPIILGCGNRNVEKLEAIMNKDRVDFFCIARPLIREPALVNRWIEGLRWSWRRLHQFESMFPKADARGNTSALRGARTNATDGNGTGANGETRLKLAIINGLSLRCPLGPRMGQTSSPQPVGGRLRNRLQRGRGATRIAGTG